MTKKIIFGICGEGMGHITRSESVIEDLLKNGHDVHIFTSGRAFDYINKKFNNVYKIKNFSLIYEQDKLKNLSSISNVIKHLPKDLLPSFKKIIKVCYDIKPDLAITDYESLTLITAKNLGIKSLSISNITILYKAKIKKIKKIFSISKIRESLSYFSSSFNCDYYIIPTFFYPKTKRKNVILTDPPLREKIINCKTFKKNHILVYNTTKNATKILDILEKFPKQNFKIYGYEKRKRNNHMQFMEFSEQGFIKDLAEAKAIITSGGFTLISEAIYLKKPILSIPLKEHFEQIMNSYYVGKNKFGKTSLDFNETDLNDFLLSLKLYQHYLNKYNIDSKEYLNKISHYVNNCELKNNILNFSTLPSRFKEYLKNHKYEKYINNK